MSTNRYSSRLAALEEYAGTEAAGFDLEAAAEDAPGLELDRRSGNWYWEEDAEDCGLDEHLAQFSLSDHDAVLERLTEGRATVTHRESREIGRSHDYLGGWYGHEIACVAGRVWVVWDWAVWDVTEGAGCHEVFETEAEARAEFDRRAQDALERKAEADSYA